MKNVLVKKKKLLAFVLFILLILFLLWLRGRREEASLPQTTEQILPTPKIDTTVANLFPIEAEFDKQSVLIPKELPVYSFSSSKMSFPEADMTATALGFKNQSFVLNDALDGTIHVWSEKNKYLQISLDRKIIDYKNTITYPLSASFLPEDQFINIASKFLTDNKLVYGNISVDIIRYVDTKAEGYRTVPKELANGIDILFRQKIGEYEIVNNTEGIGTTFVRLNRQGEIGAAYSDNADRQLNMTQNYPVMQYEQLINNLKNARVQLLDNGNIYLPDTSARNIKRIAVKKVSIVYLQETKVDQELLQPVFYLEGEAKLSDDRVVSAILYLPAVL